MIRNLKAEADAQLCSEAFDKYELPDLADYALPNGQEREKMRAFLDRVNNPYLFRVGEIGVHVVFSGQTGDTLQAHISSLLTKQL